MVSTKKSIASWYVILSRTEVFRTRKNIAIAEIQNSIFTIQECSIHERVVIEMKLYLSLKDHS